VTQYKSIKEIQCDDLIQELFSNKKLLDSIIEAKIMQNKKIEIEAQNSQLSSFIWAIIFIGIVIFLFTSYGEFVFRLLVVTVLIIYYFHVVIYIVGLFFENLFRHNKPVSKPVRHLDEMELNLIKINNINNSIYNQLKDHLLEVKSEINKLKNGKSKIELVYNKINNCNKYVEDMENFAALIYGAEKLFYFEPYKLKSYWQEKEGGMFNLLFRTEVIEKGVRSFNENYFNNPTLFTNFFKKWPFKLLNNINISIYSPHYYNVNVFEALKNLKIQEDKPSVLTSKHDEIQKGLMTKKQVVIEQSDIFKHNKEDFNKIKTTQESDVDEIDVPRHIDEDYLSNLGLLGELIALEYERIRLLAENPKKIKFLKHVSIEIGDGLGYDIESYDNNGVAYIEVKTTTNGRNSNFYISPNELKVAKSKGDSYYLMLVGILSISPLDFEIKIIKGYNNIIKYFTIELNEVYLIQKTSI